MRDALSSQHPFTDQRFRPPDLKRESQNRRRLPGVGPVRDLKMTVLLRAAAKQHDARSSARRVRPRRDFQAMEERRMRAVDLFEQDVIPAEIARRLGVGHQTVSDWRTVWRRSVRDGLRAAGRAGRLPKLKRNQLVEVETALARGAEANGY